MRSRHLISNTTQAADRKLWMHHPRIYNLTKTPLRSSPNVVKHFPRLIWATHGTLFRGWCRKNNPSRWFFIPMNVTDIGGILNNVLFSREKFAKFGGHKCYNFYVNHVCLCWEYRRNMREVMKSHIHGLRKRWGKWYPYRFMMWINTRA